MKKYIIIFSFLIPFIGTAQISNLETIVPLENLLSYDNVNNDIIYFKDVNNTLNKYVGNWIYDNGTHYLKIIVSKNLHRSQDFFGKIANPNHEDEIFVKIIYKLNGVELYNTTPTPPPSPLIVGNIINSTNVLQLHYSEPTTSCRRQKEANLLLEFIPSTTGGQGTLNWRRESRISYTSPQDECPNGTLVDSSDFIIPANLILNQE